MTSLTIQLLVSTTVIVSFSFSQGNRQERGRSNYADKQFNIKEIIRFGGKKVEVKRETTKNKVSADKDLSESLLSPLLADAYSATSLKNMVPLSGLKGLVKAKNNTGTAIVCGPNGAHLNISWVPKVIDTNKSVRIFIDITNPIDFNYGQVHLDVYIDGSPNPIFSLAADFACTDIKSVDPFTTCPLKKGEKLSVSRHYHSLEKIPGGYYVIVAKIVSYEGNQHYLFACLNFTLHVV